MKNIDVNDELVTGILKNSGYEVEEKTKLDESTEANVESEEVDLDTLTEEQIAEHVCPLCEAFIEEGISDEMVSEHIENVLSVLEEAFEEEEEADLTQQKAELLDALLQELTDEQDSE